jgi:hypothetical protein
VVLLGGSSFGVGMVLAGGCISGQLFRLGEGSLAAPVALSAASRASGSPSRSGTSSTCSRSRPRRCSGCPRELGYAGALGVQLAASRGLAALLFWKCTAVPASAREPLDLRGCCAESSPSRGRPGRAGRRSGSSATFPYLWNHPLGVTAEIGRVSALAGLSSA